MSVALVIEKVNGVQKNDYLPLSGQHFFNEVWMPLCELYELKWVPLFKTGFTFNENDLPFIIEELRFLKECTASLDNDKLKDRLNILIEKLETLRGQTSSFFIG